MSSFFNRLFWNFFMMLFISHTPCDGAGVPLVEDLKALAKGKIKSLENKIIQGDGLISTVRAPVYKRITKIIVKSLRSTLRRENIRAASKDIFYQAGFDIFDLTTKKANTDISVELLRLQDKLLSHFRELGQWHALLKDPLEKQVVSFTEVDDFWDGLIDKSMRYSLKSYLSDTDKQALVKWIAISLGGPEKFYRASESPLFTETATMTSSSALDRCSSPSSGTSSLCLSPDVRRGRSASRKGIWDDFRALQRKKMVFADQVLSVAALEMLKIDLGYSEADPQETLKRLQRKEGSLEERREEAESIQRKILLLNVAMKFRPPGQMHSTTAPLSCMKKWFMRRYLHRLVRVRDALRIEREEKRASLQSFFFRAAREEVEMLFQSALSGPSHECSPSPPSQLTFADDAEIAADNFCSQVVLGSAEHSIDAESWARKAIDYDRDAALFQVQLKLFEDEDKDVQMLREALKKTDPAESPEEHARVALLEILAHDAGFPKESFTASKKKVKKFLATNKHLSRAHTLYLLRWIALHDEPSWFNKGSYQCTSGIQA